MKTVTPPIPKSLSDALQAWRVEAIRAGLGEAGVKLFDLVQRLERDPYAAEKETILAALAANENNRAKAAGELGLGERTLYRRLTALDLFAAADAQADRLNLPRFAPGTARST